jgi:Domain of unknown function (DUF2341).
MVFLFSLIFISPVNAQLVGWGYKVDITLRNPDDAFIPNFGFNISFDTASLISENKMKSDCSDIRIVNGDVVLNHTVLKCNDQNTEIYFRLDMSNREVKTIEMYYGNPDAENTNKTLQESYYVFYDDFNSCEIDTQTKWRRLVYNNIYFDIYNYGGDYGCVIRQTAGGGRSGPLDTYGFTFLDRTGVVYEYDIRISGTGEYSSVGIARTPISNGTYYEGKMVITRLTQVTVTVQRSEL